jgi:hypothetical protein
MLRRSSENEPKIVGVELLDERRLEALQLGAVLVGEPVGGQLGECGADLAAFLGEGFE